MGLGEGIVCFMLNLSISDDVLGANVGAAIIRIGFFGWYLRTRNIKD